MRTTDAYADLHEMGRPVVTSREAATRWRKGPSTTGRRLRALEEAGLARHLRHGLWALDPDVEPFAVAPFLTAPFPAYVSLWSALSYHGVIEQIPRQISIASLDRARRISTAVGTYEIHHLAPELFGANTRFAQATQRAEGRRARMRAEQDLSGVAACRVRMQASVAGK